MGDASAIDLIFIQLIATMAQLSDRISYILLASKSTCWKVGVDIYSQPQNLIRS